MPKRYHQTLTPLFLLIALLASSTTFAAKSSPTKLKARADKEKPTVPPGSSFLDAYLVETLSVAPEKLASYNLTRKLYDKTRRGLEDEGIPPYKLLTALNKAQQNMLMDSFDEASYDIMREVTQHLGEKSYNNIMLLGPPGSGKTFSVPQLIALYSFGVIPDEIKALTGLDDIMHSNFKRQFYEAFVGKAQFYSINHQLLSLDNSGRKAMAKAEVRMRAIIQDLYDNAKMDFEQTGVRTIFVVEEAGEMRDEVFQAIKTIADEAGFKDPGNAFEHGSETGVSFLCITTPDEYRRMLKGDGAIQRRFHNVYVREPSEQKAFQTLRKLAHNYETRFGINIPDDVLGYIISMRKFFDSPPEAMPGGIIKAMDGIFNWTAIRRQRPDPTAAEITLEDAYAFLVEKAQLPKEIWMPSEPGRAPLQDLEERVKKHLVGEAMIGEDGIVDTVVRNLKIGRLNGFQEMPVYFILGPSGAGKDSLARAINLEMFGHDGSNLNFGIGVASDQQFTQIFEGAPNSDEAPELIKRLNSGTSPNGIIVLNEAKDLPSYLFDKLKLLAETATVRPVGLDSRARPLGFNGMFFMGQWGEELFDGLSDEAAMEKWREYSNDESKLIQVLQAGHADKGEGQVPFALIQRAIKTGGLVLLPPVMKKDYIHIVRRHIETIKKRLRDASQINIEVDPSVELAILRVAEINGSGTRGLQSITKAFTEAIASRATDNGFPSKNATFRLSLEDDSVKVELQQPKAKRDPVFFKMRALGGRTCASIVAAASAA